MGPHVEGSRTGGHGRPYGRDIGAGDPTLWVRNLGDPLMHHEEAGRISPTGDTLSDRAEDDMEGGWELGLPTFDGGYGRGGSRGG